MKRLNFRGLSGGICGAAMAVVVPRIGLSAVVRRAGLVAAALRAGLVAVAALTIVAAGCGGTAAHDAGDVGPTDNVTPPDVADVLPGDHGPDARDVAGNDTAGDTGGDVLPGDSAVDQGGDTADIPYQDTPTDAPADIPDTPYPDLPGDTPADAPTDVPADIPTDAQSCGVWVLTDVPMESATLADPAPLNAARSTRIAVVAILKCNQDRGMPTVAVDKATRTVTIQPRNWELPEFHCMGPDYFDTRIITVQPAATGEWTVKATDGATMTQFTVGPPPPSDCLGDSHANCTMDCDCAVGVCLGGSGLGGPFTGCALPCEDNRDCPPGNTCISADDGLDHYCDPTQECLNSDTCPEGFVCESKFCVVNFALNQSTRHECTCAGDCEPPLRCVEPSDAGGTRRCEYACPTGGGWCSGAHMCGPADADVSGLAETDSVCVWMGE